MIAPASDPEGSVPPVIAPRESESPRTGWKAVSGGIAAAFLALLKFGKGAFILLKSGKILGTTLSMVVSIWFYSLAFGWPFAVGFVLCILVHELGHVFFAWRVGVPVTAPVFIPGMGALILQKRSTGHAYSEALIGIGGPLFGLVSALICWGLYGITGEPLYIALAYTAFFLNLFNMAPVYPLDGGWITACVTPYLLIIGYLGMGAAMIMGLIRNPMIYVLILLSIPRVWQMLKKGTADEANRITTKKQRVGMGLAYVALAAILAWGAGRTHEDPALTPHQERPSPKQTV